MSNRATFEKAYLSITDLSRSVKSILIPFFRRLVRFAALPYCFSFLINWEQCTRAKHLVALDFLYIFFILKQFPSNYSPCRLWEKPREMWSFYYGSNYDPYQRKKLRRVVQPHEYEILFVDKRLTKELCRANNIPIPTELGVLEPGNNLADCLRAFTSNTGITEFIIKPTSGKGGTDVVYASNCDGSIEALKGQNQFNIANAVNDHPLIVQQFLKQHEELSKIASSVNTVRLVTLRTTCGDILIVGAYLRFGTGKSRIDNLSQGGICVSADIDTGILGSVGYDRDSVPYTCHPTSGYQFAGFAVPYWKEVLQLGVKIQKTFCYYSLLGLDIAVTDLGPVLIEVNSSYDNVDLEQAQGPILQIPAVLKAYRDYGLLINSKQRHLARNLDS